ELFKQLDTLLPKSLLSVTVVAKDYEGLKAHIKSRFKIIKAAGGIVRKGKKILMIYRLGKWDLPKGKIEKKELPEKAAVREVKEECGITVKEKKKICNTWHTYTMKKKRIMKKTSWYSLTLLDDSRMAPQQEENIELIQWMGPKEVFHALENSYESIRFVIDIHFKKRNLKWDVE
ncbi:MAG: NUDIX domain-containing protein, partial [Cyclobacteriaceae bacterium]|nr:NUDIX domain-containing protein [Cyclobacteriaceae bacterium]